MRVSTFSGFYIGSQDIRAQQVSIQQEQQRLDVQKRVLKPSDDPVAYAQILPLSQSKSRTDQFVRNGDWVEGSLATSESTIHSAINLLMSLKETAIQAGNDPVSLNPASLKDLQQEVAQGFEQLLAYANMTDGQGQYLYSGNKVDVMPFTANAQLVVTYHGDNGQRSVEVTGTSQIAITDPGSLLFGDGGANVTQAFAAVKALNDVLTSGQQSPRPATYTQDLDKAMDQLEQAFSRLVTAEASIGARRVQNTSVQEDNRNLSFLYQASISQWQDLDMAKAISNLKLTSIALEYSQEVYKLTNKVTSFIS